MRSSKFIASTLVLLLVFLNLGFFYAFAISITGVVTSLIYFLAVVLLPGGCIAGLFYSLFRSRPDQQPSWSLTLSLTTIFGIANAVVSYLIAQALHNTAYNYLFAWAFLVVLVPTVRPVLKSMIRSSVQTNEERFRGKTPIFLFFILIVNILFFLLRPTPGTVPLDINPDQIWNAGNTVSLTAQFPLRSMNIEGSPYIAYHILIHIMGAHMALITGLVPHLVGLQFIFVPLIPLLVVSMAAFLEQTLDRRDGYLLYGLAVLLFGGGFAVIHEVKVRSYIGSNTNLIGILVLFSTLSLIRQLQNLSNTGRFLSIFAGLFLATVAKGSIGVGLASGFLLWAAFRLWKKSLTPSDIADCLGAVLGFGASFLLFFVLPLRGQPVFTEGMARGGSFPLIPLSYITKNNLASPFVEAIYKYMPASVQIPSHILITLALLPIFVLLYFSYRLVALSDFQKNGVEEKDQRVLFVALGSFAVAMTVNMAPQDTAYFLMSCLFILDVYFIRVLQKERVFSLIRSSYGHRNVYALVGSLVIVSLPFITIGGWVKSEHMHNFFVYGRVGKLMDHTFAKTAYRQNHQSITPEMYEAMSFIREHTEKNAVVVSPFVDMSYGKKLTFFTSALSERTAFIEGYAYAGIAAEGLVRYVGPNEIKSKNEVIKEIYTNYSVPDSMQNAKYLYLADAQTKLELEKKYSTNTLFRNDKWNVIQVVSQR
jgi:hypothetical protein